MTKDSYDLIIVGGGMVGASLAIALADRGLRMALIEAHAPGADSQPSYDDRAIALAYGTRRIFDAIGVWPALESIVEPAVGTKLNGHQLITAITNITNRKQAECELQETHTELERRVDERTTELRKINSKLRDQITECEQAKFALRESELKYATLVEDAPIGVYIIKNDKIEFANDKFADIYGYCKDELIGCNALDLVYPDDRSMVKRFRARRLAGEKAPVEYESRGLRKNGETIWVTRSFSPITYKGRPAISGIVADISKRRKAEEALRKSDKELRVLSNQLLSAEEKERKRIARELHDSIGQALSAIKFSVENALRELHARLLADPRRRAEPLALPNPGPAGLFCVLSRRSDRRALPPMRRSCLCQGLPHGRAGRGRPARKRENGGRGQVCRLRPLSRRVSL